MTGTSAMQRADARCGLAPGDRFQVSSLRGSRYEIVFLGGHGGWVVRLTDHTLARLNPQRLQLATLQILGPEFGSLLNPGDEVWASPRGAGAEVRLTVVGLRDGALVGRRSDGRSQTFDPRQLVRLALVFRARALYQGDRFRARSRSGNALAGEVLSVLDADRIRVRLALGEEVTVRSDRLDRDSLEVEVPVDLERALRA